ncbi:GNAT family N-acetyltransferase [Spirosoma soli]|uniref:GNAT family N-acetyltransferase n=1 Tax=Spirosoma soli TaxID=1770529 RepID=A0ABW5M9M7_9BACT
MLTLQPLTEAHIEFAIQLEQHPDNRRFVGQWTPDQYRTALTDSNYQCFVLIVNEKPVGHCILYDLQNPDDSILLKRIVVQAKGNGYGRAALGEIADYWTYIHWGVKSV